MTAPLPWETEVSNEVHVFLEEPCKQAAQEGEFTLLQFSIHEAPSAGH